MLPALGCKSTTSQNVDQTAEIESTQTDFHIGDVEVSWYQGSPHPTNPISRFNSERKKLLIIIPNHGDGSRRSEEELTTPHNEVTNDFTFETVSGGKSTVDLANLLQCMPKNRKKFEEGLPVGKSDCQPADAYNVAIIKIKESVEDPQKALWDEDHSDYIDAHTLVDVYKKTIKNKESYDEITILSHSSGVNLAIRLENSLLNFIEKSEVKNLQLFNKFILAEPLFFNLPNQQDVGTMLRETTRKLSSLRLTPPHDDKLIAQTISIFSNQSNQNEKNQVITSKNIGLQLIVELRPDFIKHSYFSKKLNRSFTPYQRKQNFPLFWALETMAVEFEPSLTNNSKIKILGPSGHTSSEKIAKLKKISPNAVFKQIGGVNSASSTDDTFKFTLN